LVCLGLLLRAYSMTGGRLIFWTALCFAGLAISNVLLAVDEIVIPSVDLSWRGLPGAVGLLSLAYGLVSEEVRSRRANAERTTVRRRSGAPV
jgi:hypothetical protein